MLICLSAISCTAPKSTNTIGIDYKYIPINSNIVFSPDGSDLVFGDTIGRVIVWDLLLNNVKDRIKGDYSNIQAISISKNGEYVAAGKFDHNITIWQMSTGQRLRELVGHFYPVSSLQFSPSGKYILSGGWDNWTILWNLEDEKPLWIQKRKLSGSIDAVAFSESGSFAASGSSDKSIYIHDIKTGEVLLSLKGHIGKITNLKFYNDIHLFSTSYDATVRLWDVTSGSQITTEIAHKVLIDGFSMSYDGQYIVTCSMDKSIRIWKRSDLTLIAEVVDFDSGVKAVEFSPNTYSLAAVTEKYLWYPIDALSLIESEKNKKKYSAKDLLKICQIIDLSKSIIQ